MKASLKALIALGAVILVALVTYVWRVSQTEWIPAGHVGVLYHASSGLENKVYGPQGKYLNWFQTMYVYPTCVQNAVYTNNAVEGEGRAGDAIQITTSDNANTAFNVSVMYRVKREDVFLAFKTFGTIPIETVQSQHIRRAMKEALSAVGTQYDVFQLMGPKRKEASERMTAALAEKMGPKGITIERVLLLEPTPDSSVAVKITNQVNAYTMLAISSTRLQLAEYERQISNIQAEAENKAKSLTAMQIAGKSAQLMDLDNVEAALDKWIAAGGHLPRFQLQPGQTVIVNGLPVPTK